METIDSFKIDHLRLKPGLYISRKDYVDDLVYITTFDIRMKKPYADEIISTGSIHAIQHLGETFVRNDELWGDRVIYFGPNGSRTGFYLIVSGNVTTDLVLPLVQRTFDYIAEYEGEIPGSTPKECGNCADMDLEDAKRDAALYFNVLVDAKKDNFNYPKPRKTKGKD